MVRRYTRTKPALFGSRKRAFEMQQPALRFQSRSAAIAAQAAPAGDDAMAGNDNRHRVMRQRLAHGTAGFWPAHFRRDTLISPHLTWCDPAGRVQNIALKRSERRQIHRQVKIESCSGEVGAQL